MSTSIPSDFARPSPQLLELLPTPPENQDAGCWAAVAEAVPSWLVPPAPYDEVTDGWAAFLATPSGRRWYAECWATAREAVSQQSPAGRRLSGQDQRSLAALPLMERAKALVATLGFSTEQRWVESHWHGGFRAKWALRSFAALWSACAVWSWLALLPNVLLMAVSLCFYLPMTLVGIYVIRHVPTAPPMPRCTTCGATKRDVSTRLCQNCGRVNEVKVRAMRRGFRSL